jgi:hypothetical protein
MPRANWKELPSSLDCLFASIDFRTGNDAKSNWFPIVRSHFYDMSIISREGDCVFPSNLIFFGGVKRFQNHCMEFCPSGRFRFPDLCSVVIGGRKRWTRYGIWTFADLFENTILTTRITLLSIIIYDISLSFLFGGHFRGEDFLAGTAQWNRARSISKMFLAEIDLHSCTS